MFFHSSLVIFESNIGSFQIQEMIRVTSIKQYEILLHLKACQNYNILKFYIILKFVLLSL